MRWLSVSVGVCTILGPQPHYSPPPAPPPDGALCSRRTASLHLHSRPPHPQGRLPPRLWHTVLVAQTERAQAPTPTFRLQTALSGWHSTGTLAVSCRRCSRRPTNTRRQPRRPRPSKFQSHETYCLMQTMQTQLEMACTAHGTESTPGAVPPLCLHAYMYTAVYIRHAYL